MRVTVDDAIIDVNDRGRGDAIVLLHGFPLTRAIWNEQVDALAQRHRVICPDLRGMGESTASDGPYLMEALAGDIAAVLDACGVSRASIVGHSLGGYVALAFARMYVERVDRLALVCSRLSADSVQVAREREDLADRIEHAGGPQPAVDAFEPLLFAPGTRQSRPDLLDRYRTIARSNGPKGLAAVLRGMAQRSASDDIAGDLAMPALVLAGARDATLSLEEARSTAGAFPAGRLVVMERSGHLPMLEEAAEVTAALDAWVERVP
jgi:3-oxoadipate enol-lactonase